MVKETTKITIYDISPFRSDYQNVINFKNQAKQNAYFDNPNNAQLHAIYKADNFQFIEKTGEIYVTGRREKFDYATYMRFQNAGKMYYAFVYNAVYINENTTRIIYELDLWNTYQNMVTSPANKISATIFQRHETSTKSRPITAAQGFDFGTKQNVYKYPVIDLVDWLVIVTKPGFNFKGENAYRFSVSGTTKSLNYFFVPVDMTDNKSLAFEINGQSYASKSLYDLFADCFGFAVDGKPFNIDFADVNAVKKFANNNIVNMYYSRYVGLDYDYDASNKVVKIKTEQPNKYAVVPIGGNTSGGSLSSSAVSVGGPEGTAEERVIKFTRAVKKNLPTATVEGIAGAIGCFGGESDVTAKRYEADFASRPPYNWAVAKDDPTAEGLFGGWGGFQAKYSIGLNQSAYQAGGKHWIGLGLGQWTGPRAKALFDFARSKGMTWWDMDAQVQFMFSEGDANTAKAILSSHDSVANNVTAWLTRWERGGYDNIAKRQAYAQKYLPLIKKTFNETTSDGSSNAQPNNDKPTASDKNEKPKAVLTEKVLAQAKGYLGRRVGNGQCYALVSLYCKLFRDNGQPAPGLGADVGGLDGAIGDTNAAANIGVGYNWAKYGWAVKLNPTAEDLKKSVGAIVNIKPFQSPAISEYGHTAVLLGYDGTKMTVLEQNGVAGQVVAQQTYTVPASHVSSICLPPDVAKGAQINGLVAGDASGAGGDGSVSDAKFWLINVDKQFRAAPKIIEVGDMREACIARIKQYIKTTLGEDTLNKLDPKIETALLRREIIEVELSDFWGNSYSYDPALFGRTSNNKQGKPTNSLMLLGCIGDYNQSWAGIYPYNTWTQADYTPDKILNGYFFNPQRGEKSDRDLKGKRYAMPYGIMDTSGKNLTIINDSTANYIQANANSIAAKRQNFVENADLLNRSNALNSAQTALANSKAAYNAAYNVNKTNTTISGSKLNGAKTGIDWLGDHLPFGWGNGFKKAGEAIASYQLGGNAGAMELQQMEAANAKQQREFTGQENDLRDQSTALANMQAKVSYDQQVRAFNASLRDVGNQPDTVQQMGDDISFQTSNFQEDLYISFNIINARALEAVINYLYKFGIKWKEEVDDLRTYFTKRKKFTYLLADNLDMSQLLIPQSDLIVLKAIFQTGVRLWDFDQIDQNDRNPFKFEGANDIIETT